MNEIEKMPSESVAFSFGRNKKFKGFRMMEINRKNIQKYAKIYDERTKPDDASTEKEIKEWLKNNRFLDRERFIKLARWKSQRPAKWYENNDDLTVREITQFSFNARSEKAKIKSLFALEGVSYPVASAILHFASPKRYPILDFRAVRSLWGIEIEQKFDFWDRYCERIREIAKSTSEDIRTIDKALWKFDEIESKKH